MSTLSGTASKGEKTKPKFQSLDINSLYKNSRGESTEKPAQKSSSSYIKHGMQSLGKVPNARRAPANLPSLKSEHSESGAAVPLVPPGSTGWGKQEQGGTQSSTAPQNGAPPSQVSTPVVQGPPQLTPHQQAIAIPSTNIIPPHNKQNLHPAPTAAISGGDKLWSAVTSGGQQDGNSAHPPAYQSAQFQHEFPSLSAGDGSAAVPSDYTAVGPAVGNQTGLSLRPQTEGSWTQGGQRTADATARGGSGPPGVPPQLGGQVGRVPETVPPQIRGVLPPFMYKGSYPQGASLTGPTNQHSQPTQSSGSHNGRRQMDARPPRLQDVPTEDLAPRPIIREEELSQLDEFGHDMGWATSDDIDYNQKLAFSDDEDRPHKRDKLQQQKSSDRQTPPKHWNASRSDNHRGRTSDEDDAMAQKQRQQQKEIDLAIQRAKQRKEEEEKRFNEETRQRAHKKLQELDEKVREKRDRDRESEVGTISPSAVPPKPINNHVDIPLPEFQKEKDKPRTTVELPNKEESSGFRQLTQIEGKTFPTRKPQQKPDHREQNGHSFSRQFQTDLPPRFLKQQRNAGPPPPQIQSGYQLQYDSNKWASVPQRTPSRGGRSESPDEDRRDYKRQSSEDSYRSSHQSQPDQYGIQKSPDGRFSDKEEDKWQPKEKKSETHFEERRSQERFERPQRPDSRDSHTSHGSQGSNRRSRDSDLKESMGSWNEDVEAAYEEKERVKDEKRSVPALVPGPITRDRIEAEDLNEKRALTQLRKGEILPPKSAEALKKEEKTRTNEKTAWPESVPVSDIGEPKKEGEKSDVDSKVTKKHHEDYKERQIRNNYSQGNSGWGSGSSDFHSKSPWANKRPQGRWHKPGGREFYGHGTDSDGSTETYLTESKDVKSKKPLDKEDKNRENKQEKSSGEQKKAPSTGQEKKDDRSGYVPKGEPSRHGRGGGNNFRGSRMGGMSKRIDGYGPPPSKSPFGHHDEKKPEDGSTESAPTDKIKQNQEALAAGIIGKPRQEGEDKNRPKSKPRNKSKTRKDEQDNGEFSDGSKRQPVSRSSSQRGGLGGDRRGGSDRRDRNTGPRTGGEKRMGSFEQKKSDPHNLLASAIADIPLKNRDEEQKGEQKDGGSNDMNGDSDGFQEVKNKKTVKDRPKGVEEKKVAAPRVETKDLRQDKKSGGKPSGIQQMTPQQIQNIPSLMSTPVNPPPMLHSAKVQYNQRSNNRQTKLAPRFAKQKMQQQMIGEPTDNVSKVPYGMRDTERQVVQPPTGSAWDKPLSAQLRPADNDPTNLLGVAIEGMNLESGTPSPGHGASPAGEKVLAKSAQITDKSLLDGATPPVNTIIFENTNFKSAPGARSASRGSVSGPPSADRPRSKLEENMEANVFTKPIDDLLQKSDDGKADAIQISFKEETDMKLDFFGTGLTHLTEEKSSKTLCMAKSITSVNSTICNADSLNMKIASVKKVWETPEQEGDDTSGISFGTPLDTAFKGSDAQEEHHEGFSPGGQAASTTNVCKVKPTQQVSNATGQPSSASQQPHSALAGHPMLLGTPLSPPPMQAAVGVSLGPQGFATNQHLTGFPTAAAAQSAGSAQYGISAIPSPPTVLYNSTQQLQSGLYGAFLPPADQASVLGSQGHARPGGFGQYPAAAQPTNSPYLLGQPANSHYNTQSVFLQTAPHPPPSAQPPEMYPSMNSFRLSAAGPFGQNQALNNPTGAPATVLISSTSNSLMSASVKPSSQPISAIGTKAGGVGQAYQQQSQQGQQVYMAYEPLQAANYLPGAGVMQRGHTGPPVQNSVVPGLQPSSSYYSGSTGGQTGYYQQPGSSTLQSGPQLPQHQAGYGLQGNIFGTHNQSHTNTGIQGSFPFLSTQMQVAAALNAQQQYRSAAAASLQNPYVKNVGGSQQQMSGDQCQRPQQLKSPSSQEVLSSVFSGQQIPSPKSKQNSKHPPQQSSPTAQRKYNFYQGVGNQQNNMQQRYPAPIQRPINFQQQNMNSMQQNSGSNNPKHNRNNSNKAPNRQYYGGQSGSLGSNPNDKSDDPKVTDSAVSKPAPNPDMTKDGIKEDATVLKE